MLNKSKVDSDDEDPDNKNIDSKSTKDIFNEAQENKELKQLLN